MTRRPRIGFLARRIWDSFAIPLWRGVQDACRERDADLVTYVGTNLRAAWSTALVQGFTVYDLIDAENIDGLVVSASSLISFIGKEAMSALYGRFGSLPIVNISHAVEDRPTVAVDNYGGMRALVSHLIDVHGRRSIVFIPGPLENEEVQDRYRGYSDALRERGLPVERELLAPAGSWDWDTGRLSMRAFLGEKHPEFDAVVAVTDGLAIGAIEALKDADIAVPERVSVTGFNNSLEAILIDPAITTVQQPIYELSKTAVYSLFSLIRGEQVPPLETLRTSLAIRRSCGCGTEGQAHESEAGAGESPGRAVSIPMEERDRIVSDMARIMTTYDGVLPLDWASRLLDAFLSEAGGASPGGFLQECGAILRRISSCGRDADELKEIFSLLDSRTRRLFGDEMGKRALEMLANARMAVTDESGMAAMRRDWIRTNEHRLSFEMETAMDFAVDEEGMIDTLIRKLPGLGIRACFVATYVDPSAPASLAAPMVMYRDGTRIPVGKNCANIPSRSLVPREFLPGDERRSLVVLPLFFQEMNAGYAVCEVGMADGKAYEIVRQELSGALQKILLIRLQEQARTSLERLVEERTAQLTGEVSERRRVEEALLREQHLMRSLIDNTPDLIYFKDAESRFIGMNAALAAYLGLSDPGEGFGKSDFDFYARGFAEKTRADELRVMETGVPVVGIEEMVRWPDGREMWNSTTKVPLQDADAKIVGILGISRDITENKKIDGEVRRLNEELEERVKRRTAELESAYRDLESFSHTVSHDLRAPLRAMNGFANIFLEKYGLKVPPEGTRLARTIAENAARLGRLIDDLLEFTRFSRRMVASNPVSMADLAREALESLRNQREGRLVTVTFGALPDCRGDPVLLRQVWVNLISNALKFTGKKKDARIEIGCTRRGGRNVFFIRDNGVGFDMKYADKLFGVFQRLHRADEYEGTGIGLAMVQRILNGHGGRIWAEAEPDRGACFFFIIGGDAGGAC